MRLFKVEFTDGSQFKQNKEDVSLVNPKRSAFYDVLNSNKEVKTFEIGPIKVNLLDGSFLINGVGVQVEENPTDCKRKLIFFRQHQHELAVDYQADKKGIMKLIGQKEVGHKLTYFVGWEANIKGKVTKHIIGIK